MSAADCPTKSAAFMTDMTLGRWSHVPACVKLLYKMSVSGCLGQPKVSKDTSTTLISSLEAPLP